MSQGCLAISTAWNSNTHSDVKEMLSNIHSVGLDAIEIGYNFSPERLKELVPLIDAMGIKVVSVHNFCPLPSSRARANRSLTDYYRLSSLDEKERERAVDHTKKSIDTACSVSCGVVVIHAGAVELKDDYVRRLLDLYNQGKSGSEEYLEMRERLLVARHIKRIDYLESVTRSLEEILPYARSAGIKIGLETRYYPDEIPNIEEAEHLLSLFRDEGLFYWHDVGHAEVNERLGITSHSSYLRRFADCMIGMHLHDLKGIDDHLAPFSGDFDWSLIAPYMRNGLIKVIEAHQQATPQQIKESVKRLSL